MTGGILPSSARRQNETWVGVPPKKPDLAIIALHFEKRLHDAKNLA
jgi:hypothetical protein